MNITTIIQIPGMQETVIWMEKGASHAPQLQQTQLKTNHLKRGVYKAPSILKIIWSVIWKELFQISY